jgi:hypothetical protein
VVGEELIISVTRAGFHVTNAFAMKPNLADPAHYSTPPNRFVLAGGVFTTTIMLLVTKRLTGSEAEGYPKRGDELDWRAKAQAKFLALVLSS